MRVFFLTLFAAAALACGGPKAEEPSPNAKRYPLKGSVVSVDAAAKKVKVDHEKIEGFMERMTMDFPVRADWVWSEITPGAQITADLVVDSAAKDPYWLENIVITSSAKAGQPAVELNENFVQIGKEVPDFRLTDQDGKTFSFNDFRGKAFAVTFIYARCPLPDYCIRMSTAFSDLAIELNKDPDLKDKIRLVSISFDPANDTPAKLRSYGIGYMGNSSTPDFTVWRLAVGADAEVRKVADFFGLHYEVDPNDKTQFVHSLRTAVISPEGKVTKVLPGSEWTSADLKTELVNSLTPSAAK